MRRSGIIITILLLVAVLALMLVSTGLIPLPFLDFNKIGKPFSQNTFQGMSFNARLDEKTEHTTEATPELRVNVAHGQIGIEGATVEEIQINMHVQVKAVTPLRAQELIKGTSLKITNDTNENIIQTITPQLRSNESVRVDLNIVVPIQTNLDLKTNLGEIIIENTQGKLSAKNDLGGIKLQNFRGNAVLETALGNIEISDSKFDRELSVTSDLGDLNIAASLAKKNTLESSLGDLNLLLSPDEAYILEGNIDLGSIFVNVPFKGRQDKNHIQGVIGEGEQRGTILLNVSLGSLQLKNQTNGRD